MSGERWFVHSMLLTWSAAQAVCGVLMIALGVRHGVWYVAVLGGASFVIGTAIFMEELTDDV